MINNYIDTIELFTHLLESKSETPDDGGLLDFISEYLGDFNATRVDLGGVKNLFLSKKFGEGSHLCFAGHVDVVPAGDGWSSDPYRATLKDGYIYARGAQDMKSGVCAQIQALKKCKQFDGTLSLLLTSDEEGDATYGTIKVLEHLKQTSQLPDAVVVAEPTCEEKFGDAIKIGRRGSINGCLTLKGRQGHAAYPQKCLNPIHEISKILPHIADHNLDDGDQFFAPSRFIVTDIRSGLEVTNVTPDSLKMMFNIRNSTKTSLQDVEKFISTHFKDQDYELELTQSASPFITDSSSKIVKAIDNSIKLVTQISPKHSTAGGTSDARFVAAFDIDVIEFGVINDTIHAANERTSIKEVLDLESVFVDLIGHYSRLNRC